MGAGRHVGSHDVEQAVVVDVSDIAAHGEPGRVREDRGAHIGEGAVAVVAVKAIGAVEVVGDVDIGPTIVVVIPPDDAEPFVVSGNTGLFGDFGERAVAVVVIEVVVLADLDDAVASVGHANRIVELPIFFRNARHTLFVELEPIFDFLLGRNVIGEQIAVEQAIAIVIGERHLDA